MVTRGWGAGEDVELLLHIMGYEVSFGSDENFLNWLVVMVT